MVKPLFADVSVETKPLFASAGASFSTQLAPAGVTSTALVTITDDQIEQLGDKSTTQLAALSGKMLGSVRASDADVFGDKLNALVGVAKGLDPSKFNDKGVLAKIKGLFGTVKEKMLSEYQTVEKRMDSLIIELDRSAVLFTQRIGDLEEMFNVNVKAHQNLEAAVAEGQNFLVTMRVDLETIKSVVNPDSFTAQQIFDQTSRIERLEKRIDDLQRAMLLAKQTAPQIRLLQENSRTLASKFKDVKVTTIPAWKNAFTLYLVQLEQKKGAALANSVHDATDEAFRLQADALRQGTQEIAKAKQRSVVSFEVIQHVQTQLIGAFDDMAKIAEEGKRARADAAPKLVALEQQLISHFASKKA